jgi:hypothetical protein
MDLKNSGGFSLYTFTKDYYFKSFSAKYNKLDEKIEKK